MQKREFRMLKADGIHDVSVVWFCAFHHDERMSASSERAFTILAKAAQTGRRLLEFDSPITIVTMIDYLAVNPYIHTHTLTNAGTDRP
jgi:hypothetical protein